MKNLKKGFYAMLIFGAVLIGFQSNSSALTLTLESGLFNISIDDNGLFDANPAPGAITYIGGIGNFNLNVTTGFSDPAINFPLLMDLVSGNISSNEGGTLTITLSDSGFNLPSPSPGSFIMEIGGTTQGNLSYNAYFAIFRGMN